MGGAGPRERGHREQLMGGAGPGERERSIIAQGATNGRSWPWRERGVSLHREQLMGGAGSGERGVSLHREQLMGGAGPGEREEYHCTGSN